MLILGLLIDLVANGARGCLFWHATWRARRFNGSQLFRTLWWPRGIMAFTRAFRNLQGKFSTAIATFNFQPRFNFSTAIRCFSFHNRVVIFNAQLRFQLSTAIQIFNAQLRFQLSTAIQRRLSSASYCVHRFIPFHYSTIPLHIPFHIPVQQIRDTQLVGNPYIAN